MKHKTFTIYGMKHFFVLFLLMAFSTTSYGQPPAVTATTGPTTCGGTNGLIRISNLLLNQPYIVYYEKNSTGLPGAFVLSTDGSGNLDIVTWGTFTMTAGTYTNIQVSDGVTPSFFAGPYILTDPAPPVVGISSNSPVCEGSTLNLGTTATGATYSWTGPNGFASNAQNPSVAPVTMATAGVYNVTVTDNTTLCANSDNTTVVVTPGPTADAIGNYTLCNGGNIAAGINFTGTATTYTWTNNTPSIGLAANGTGDIASFTATNTGTTDVVATVTVSPSTGVCTGASQMFTITVRPTPTVNTVADQIVCNGASTSAVAFTGAVAGTTYSWTNNTTSIGLGANGTGNISAFTAANTSAAPVTATVMVQPVANSCPGATESFDITVNPTPTVNAVANQAVCNGANTTAINFTGSAVAGTTYSWTNSNTAIGLAANGTGDISAFTAINNTAAPVTATIVVTPSANGCNGAVQVFDIVVNPTPTVNTIADQALCNGANTAAVTFSGAVAGTTYSWTNNTTSIGLGANGTGNIGAFAAMNTGAAPVTATITVTPSANSCSGASETFDITVNPTPDVAAVTNQAVCNGASTAAVNFSGAVTGTTYSWTNNTTSIGLGANGTGNIAAFTATNTTSAPVTATIMVTPSANGCPGTPATFDITVNPTPTVNAIASQTICNGANTAAINYTGAVAGTTYSWTNNTPSIGLAANGTGDLAAFAGTNTTSAPVTATITVTPTANGCSGASAMFSILVNPTPAVNAVASQTRCNGVATSAITFAGSAVTGTTYNWTNSHTSIGLGASGSGNIAAFTATNTTNTPVVATITVTPVANGCSGTAATFNITVNPTPGIGAVANIVRCSGTQSGNIIFSSPVAGANYAWTNTTSSIGLGASGTGNIPTFMTTNTGTSPVVATITVTPSANGCTGPSTNFTLTVNPIPTVNNIASQVVCNGGNTAPIIFGGTVSNTAYLWTHNRPSIGLMASGAGDIVSFPVTNTTTVPVAATFIVTPLANGCSGSNKIFSITVNPTPEINTVTDKVFCNGENTTAVTFSGIVTGTTYTWTNNNTAIGLGAGGAGNIASFVATNTTPDPISANITVTPRANNCNGPSTSFEIVVNPTPVFTSSLTPPAICDGRTFNYIPTSSTTGTSFAWTRAAVAGISNMPSSGTGNPLEVLVNITPAPITVDYVYTLEANGCLNTQTVSVVVNPTPRLSGNTSFIMCSGDEFNFTPVSLVAGATFNWIRTPMAGIMPTGNNGTGAIKEVLTNSTSSAIDVIYYYTVSANGCDHENQVTVKVNPTPAVPQITIKGPDAVCSNTQFQNFGASEPAAAGSEYTWFATNAEVWSQSATRQNVLINFPWPGTSTVTLTSTIGATGCKTMTEHTVSISGSTSIQPEVIYHNGRFICLYSQAQSYRWGYDNKLTLDSTMIANATNQDYLNTSPDFTNNLYWVMTTKDGCVQKSYYNKPTDIAALPAAGNNISLYPNPANDIVNIELENYVTNVVFVIYDMAGRQVKTVNAMSKATAVDISALSQGFYTVNCMKDGTRIASTKFIKH